MDSLNNGIDLAIVIPFYKINYLREALKSIEAQTNQNFNLYIGDDASLNSIKKVIDELNNDLKKRVTYYRFSENLGASSLTKQWERCIDLCKDEKYIWLFSDDDVMPDDAVQRFYDFINISTDKDVLRFNISIINNKGEVLGRPEPHPAFETAENFARRRIHGECISTACEYIFSRAIYKAKNGFVEFPLAWCSDDATWIKFSAEKGIVTISGKPVLWRMSGINISSDSEKAYELKFSSAILFIKFLREKFAFSKKEELEWLLGQLYLVGHLSKYKKEFLNQLAESNLFEQSFIKTHLIKRNVKQFLNKIKRKLT